MTDTWISPPEGPFEHLVDCGAGTAVDRTLEPETAEWVAQSSKHEHGRQEAAERRAQALRRLQLIVAAEPEDAFLTVTDLRDLLTVLGASP